MWPKLFLITCDPSGIACPFKAAVLRSSAESLLLWGNVFGGGTKPPAGAGAHFARLLKPRQGAWRRLEQPLGRAAARLDEIPSERNCAPGAKDNARCTWIRKP